MDEHIQEFLTQRDHLIERRQRRSAGVRDFFEVYSVFDVLGDTDVSYMQPVMFSAGTHYLVTSYDANILTERHGPHYIRTVLEFDEADALRTATAKFPILNDVYALEPFKDDPKRCIKTNNPAVLPLLDMEAEMCLEAISEYGIVQMNMPLTHGSSKRIVEKYLTLVQNEIHAIERQMDRRFFGWRERGLHKQMFRKLEEFGMEHGLTFE